MLTIIPVHTLPTWQDSLSNLVTDPQELLKIVGLTAEQAGLSAAALNDFPLKVPRPYLARVAQGNPHDPLLLQILPKHAETLILPDYTQDPLDEGSSNPHPGLLHKYHGRVLLIATSSCAIHCRYCFRRHFPYDDNRPGKRQWQETLGYLAQNSSINEVILSGGDPFTLSDKHLRWLVTELNCIPHLKRLRVHTRLPIMIPQRVTTSLCQLLAQQRLQTIVVIHSNHAQEFDHDVDTACLRLQQEGGVQLLNQSVLLKGINDSADALVTLSERLFQAGVLPYYLHLLDKVTGVQHFDTSLDEARALISDIQGKLPGYLVPKLVCETPGQSSKTLLHSA